MPPVETVDFLHYAVLWRRTGQNRFGKPIIAVPSQIRCRWIESTQEKVDAQGNTITISGQVYVNTDIPIGSLMWKGKLLDLLGTDQHPSGNVMQVISFSSTPDLKGRNHRKMATIARYMDTLPDIE